MNGWPKGKRQTDVIRWPVVLAVRNGPFDIVELLIREHPRLTSLTNNAGESALFLAVDRAFYKIALHILEEEQLTFQDAHMVEEIKWMSCM